MILGDNNGYIMNISGIVRQKQVLSSGAGNYFSPLLIPAPAHKSSCALVVSALSRLSLYKVLFVESCDMFFIFVRFVSSALRHWHDCCCATRATPNIMFGVALVAQQQSFRMHLVGLTAYETLYKMKASRKNLEPGLDPEFAKYAVWLASYGMSVTNILWNVPRPFSAKYSLQSVATVLF